MNRVVGEDVASDDLTSTRFSRIPLVLSVRTLLCELPQVDLMSSAWCGEFFAAALFAAGWHYGVFALLGTAVSTLSALVWQVDRVPAAMLRYAGSPGALDVGRPGKVGLLELGFERIGART